MILQPPLERGPRGRALREPRAILGTGRGLDARSPSSEVLLWRYPGNLIPEALRLLRLGDPPAPSSPAAPTGDGREP
ncbi:host cell factor C1 regulator 1 isoform X2 [Ochotona princeps]|uniref:host cell factor C1 regulator 1 isoform X2 n=1 Tax=Ochotona princeps TaxID=9978 RepID=UPI002714C28F|nr:host cell factor C1 regulator 1 isoform X2 [Ochotona princeps]